VFTVTERHISAEAAEGMEVAAFKDSVGVGCHEIILHCSTGGNSYIYIPALPFHIPLGALIPMRVENLLPACKNIGTTHLTNGAYRMHPIEWNIGEAAGLLAAFCLARHVKPHQVREDREKLQAFQKLLEDQGFELVWPQIRRAPILHQWDLPPGIASDEIMET
jgi:hypothetical protein